VAAEEESPRSRNGGGVRRINPGESRAGIFWDGAAGRKCEGGAVAEGKKLMAGRWRWHRRVRGGDAGSFGHCWETNQSFYRPEKYQGEVTASEKKLDLSDSGIAPPVKFRDAKIAQGRFTRKKRADRRH